VHVIATAGHVDHGKSTLIRELTGMEPDRLAEERRRGMTIDLGIAWTTLPGGTVVAFVDVPGHQRFVTTMLAGVGPVPAVLFVVAADQGWSAQSTEHRDALTVLGVRHGVLAITRSDLGDAELAEEEARDYLAGTPLADLPAVAVSPVTGWGMTELRGALEQMTARLPAPVERPTRLWIDRVFTIRGAGTVVTGTLSSGTLRVGDALQVRPSGHLVDVRGLESLKSPVEEASALSRVAVNLRGVKAADLHRGDALTAPGGWADVASMDVRVTADPRDLPRQLLLHLGSAAVVAHVRPLGADTARLRLATPLPVHIGERIALRDAGQQRIAAGGVVLDTMPAPLIRRGAARRRAEELLDLSGDPDAASEVRRRGAVRTSDLIAAGAWDGRPNQPPPSRALAIGDWLVDVDRWQDWRRELGAAVDAWAAAHPLLPGMPRRAAVDQVALPDPAMLGMLVQADPELVLDAGGVHRIGVTATVPEAAEHQLQLLLERLAERPFAAPEAHELAAAGLGEKVLATATRDGRLVRVGPGIYLHPAAIDEAVRRLRELGRPFTASEARQLLDTTRRVALPLLEHLDRAGRTRRTDAQLRSVRS
jgi:selenocysteine-specific elongation factor